MVCNHPLPSKQSYLCFSEVKHYFAPPAMLSEANNEALYAAWEVSISVKNFKLIRLRAVSLLPENLRARCSWLGRLHMYTSHIRLIASRLAQVFDQKRDCSQSIMV